MMNSRRGGSPARIAKRIPTARIKRPRSSADVTANLLTGPRADAELQRRDAPDHQNQRLGTWSTSDGDGIAVQMVANTMDDQRQHHERADTP